MEKLQVCYLDNSNIGLIEKKDSAITPPPNENAVEILIGMIAIQQLREKINSIDTKLIKEIRFQEIIYLHIIQKLQTKIKVLIDEIHDKINSLTLNNLINAIKANYYYYKIQDRYYQTSMFGDMSPKDILSTIQLAGNNQAIKIHNTQKERLKSSIIDFFHKDKKINDIEKNIQTYKNNNIYDIITRYINTNIDDNIDKKKSIEDSASSIFENIDSWISNNPINESGLEIIRKASEDPTNLWRAARADNLIPLMTTQDLS